MIALAQRTRCTGHCCRLIKVGNGRSIASLVNLAIEADDVEAATVADMLRPFIGERPFPELEGRALPLWITEKDRFFTCRHFDGTNCTNYEGRPSMCAGYPYGRACEVTGCTWDPEETKLISGVLDNFSRLRPKPHVEELVQIRRGLGRCVRAATEAEMRSEQEKKTSDFVPVGDLVPDYLNFQRKASEHDGKHYAVPFVPLKGDLEGFAIMPLAQFDVAWRGVVFTLEGRICGTVVISPALLLTKPQGIVNAEIDARVREIVTGVKDGKIVPQEPKESHIVPPTER